MDYLEEKMKKHMSKEEEIVQLIKQLADEKNKSAQLEHIIDSLPGHVYWMDREGHILGCNDEQANDFGISSRLEMVGKTIYDFQQKKLADNILINNNQILRTKKPLLIEEQTVLTNGNKKIFLSHKAPLKDKSGRAIGVIGISTDITAHKNNENTLENIIAMMPGNVYWINQKGICLGCNQNLVNIMGFSLKKEIVGHSPYRLMSKELAKLTRENDRKIMVSGIAQTFEEEGIDIGGKPATYLTKKVPLKNDAGKVVGLVGISLDITERKLMERKLKKAKEQAEMANEAKSDFLDNMRHDIRTPLSNIVGLSTILTTMEKNKEKKEFVNAIQVSGKALLELMTRILEFDNIETGRKPIAHVSFSLQRLLTELIKIHEASMINKHIKISINYDNRIPDKIIGDQERIHRILLNLVSNAIKFTEEGSIIISIEVAKKDQKNIFIKFTVKDTGIGIPKDKFEVIFDKFNRLTHSYNGTYQGEGLGLYIVKSFVTELEGSIKVTSKIGKGSTFTCIIPFVIP